MIEPTSKKQVVAKLTIARSEMDDVLRLSTPAARYDPVLLSPAAKNQLSLLRDNLNKIICALEGEQ